MKKLMLFIDGENLLLRYQDMLSNGYEANDSVLHEKDKYLWHPNLSTIQHGDLLRVLYYTSYVGDEAALNNFKEEISNIDYRFKAARGISGHGTINPCIFKKDSKSRKTKSVDINITIDIMRHVYNDTVDNILLISGDGDYCPLIEDIMRHGKLVHVMAFSSGLNPKLKYLPDDFTCLDHTFFKKKES